MTRCALALLCATAVGCGAGGSDAGDAGAGDSGTDCDGSPCPPDLLPNGAPCNLDSKCVSGNCVIHSGGSLCSIECDVEPDCVTGFSCGHVLEAGALKPTTVCVPSGPGNRPAGSVCTTGDDCESVLCVGRLCREICVTCDPGEVCEPVTIDVLGSPVDTNICRWFFPPPDLELGPAVTPASGSAEIQLDVPAGVVAFVVTLVDEQGLTVAVRSLAAPDGTVLVDLNDGMTDLNRQFWYPGAASLLIPNTDDPVSAVQPGTYRMTVGTYDPASFLPLVESAGDIERIAVVFEYEGEQGGMLDLNLHISPGVGVDPANAATDLLVIDMLAQVENYLALADIRLREVRFSGLPSMYDDIQTEVQLRELCTDYSAPGTRGTAVNAMLVADLPVTGISAGLPGPPGLYGLPASCLVVRNRATGGADTGAALVHEILHFLGLFHTTELALTLFDAISDTPECPGGTMPADCPDYTNLMFPAADASASLVLTPGQILIERLNPLLYEINRLAACPSADGTYDVTDTGHGTGDTTFLGADFQGTCGGDVAPERLQLYRLDAAGLSALEVRVTGIDFAPLVHVRGDDCADPAAELACDSGDTGVAVVLSLPAPAPGGYFIWVDGRDGIGGTFVLEVEEIP